MFQMSQYLVVTYSTEIIVGNFSYDFLKVFETELLDVLPDDVQMVNESAYISGSLIYHVNVKNSLMEELFTNATVQNIYFSDHDAVRIVI